jgi:adenosylcobyric acid synthase
MKPLMILGTGSDVGKSVIAAAFCRIFHQEGIRVAPFKAQNMALNSFITREGGEMGRAQVVQAQAAGLEPHVDMNPILLKPTGDAGSQIIVHGKVWSNLKASDYYRQKQRLVGKVMASFRRLQQQYDLIVLEGAGSAAELNLKKTDLVNFSMAKRAAAAVILVADIDRGGVFASTIGTFRLLTPSERRRLAGFIINKFRGDPSLFEDGIRIIEKKTDRPVFGVLPYTPDLMIPQEDSVALDRRKGRERWEEKSSMKIGVIRLPRISNYTDFDPLEQERGVSLCYLDHGDRLDGVDLLIIPGSKNTISDLRYLKETGLFNRILDYGRTGGCIIGVCGGFQILGQTIRDPLGVEGDQKEESGLDLLPLVTTMAGKKTTTQVKASALGFPGLDPVGLLTAYEIHMGFSESVGPGKPAFEIKDRNGRAVKVLDGWVHPNGRIWGTYLHGVFDNDAFRKKLLDTIAEGKGIAWEGKDSGSFGAFLEAQFDRLADLVRRNVDMDGIRALIDLEATHFPAAKSIHRSMGQVPVNETENQKC